MGRIVMQAQKSSLGLLETLDDLLFKLGTFSTGRIPAWTSSIEASRYAMNEMITYRFRRRTELIRRSSREKMVRPGTSSRLAKTSPERYTDFVKRYDVWTRSPSGRLMWNFVT